MAMRLLGTAPILLIALLACRNDRDTTSEQRPDPASLTNSSGEVSLTDGSSLDYVITSERYKKWDAAQRSLTRDVSRRFGQLLNPRAPSEQSINRAVAYLEGQPAARQAIQGAGLSVRDFVVMTVALEQQMQLASSRGAAPEYPIDPMIDSTYPPAPPTATPYPDPYPSASAYPSPAPAYPPTPAYPAAPVYPPATVNPRPVDSARPDTQFRSPRRDTTMRRDTTLRRDSVSRRDSLPARRDTSSLPQRRDTTSPPDSVALR